jgi:hypothetical protein
VKQKHKILVGWIAFSYVVIHTLLISISTVPEPLLSFESKKKFDVYLSPIFTQDWRMFYPCPTTEGRFKMKIHYDDEVVDWFYPTTEDRKWYRRLRMTHHGELALAEFNYAHWVIGDLTDLGWVIGEPSTQGNIDDFESTFSYRRVKIYAYAIGLKIRDKAPDRVELVCEMTDVISGKSDEFKFPDYEWKN